MSFVSILPSRLGSRWQGSLAAVLLAEGVSCSAMPKTSAKSSPCVTDATALAGIVSPPARNFGRICPGPLGSFRPSRVYFSPRMNGRMPPWNRGYSMRHLETSASAGPDFPSSSSRAVKNLRENIRGTFLCLTYPHIYMFKISRSEFCGILCLSSKLGIRSAV